MTVIKHTMTQVGGLGLPNAAILQIFRGPQGSSAYEVAVEAGFVGDEAAWLASLASNEPGPPGSNAYQVAVAAGFVGDEAAWLASLASSEAGPPGPQGPPSAGGGALNGNWNFDAGTTAADPGTGEVAFNSGAYATVSAIYISQTNAASGDVTSYLTSLKVADSIFVQDASNVNKWLRATISALPTDNGAWWTIPVTYASNGSGGMITAAQSCVITFLLGGVAGSDGFGSSINTLLAVADSAGRKVIDIQAPVLIKEALTLRDSLEITEAGGIKTSTQAFENSNKFPFAVADAAGNLALVVTPSGEVKGNFAGVAADTGAVVNHAGTYDWEVNHIFTYGQSLSVGQASPAISTTQAYDNVMFYRGMIPQYQFAAEDPATVWYQSFVPAVEIDGVAAPDLDETPCTATGNMVKQLIADEQGTLYTEQKYQLALSAPGYGAQAIAGLSKGTSNFNRMVAQATAGASLSAAADKTYGVGAVTWIQGESDYIGNLPRASYITAMNTLVTDINTDLKAVTGQTKDIKLISYQVASHKVYSRTVPLIALAQLDVAVANANVHMACPMYQFEYAAVGDAHLSGYSSAWLGAYMGLAYKRIVVDGEDWSPLRPLSAVKSGKIITMKFHVPHGKLELDTINVAANTNYGFECVDAADAALTIASVSVISYDTVKIVLSAAVPVGAKVRYAWSGSGTSGNTVGPRGNLRDTQGDTIVYKALNAKMHNWCVIFEQGVL